MPRYCWMAEVRPGCEEEYKRRHDEIWPEMLDALRVAGFRDYWIFRHGLQLILTFECDDVEALMAAIQGNPVDARWGEAVKALVVPRPGVRPTAEDLMAFARERLAGYKLPRSVDFVAELPRTPSGKVLKRELRSQYS